VDQLRLADIVTTGVDTAMTGVTAGHAIDDVSVESGGSSAPTAAGIANDNGASGVVATGNGSGEHVDLEGDIVVGCDVGADDGARDKNGADDAKGRLPSQSDAAANTTAAYLDSTCFDFVGGGGVGGGNLGGGGGGSDGGKSTVRGSIFDFARRSCGPNAYAGCLSFNDAADDNNDDHDDGCSAGDYEKHKKLIEGIGYGNDSNASAILAIINAGFTCLHARIQSLNDNNVGGGNRKPLTAHGSGSGTVGGPNSGTVGGPHGEYNANAEVSLTNFVLI
jgi:hypothetical protein